MVMLFSEKFSCLLSDFVGLCIIVMTYGGWLFVKCAKKGWWLKIGPKVSLTVFVHLRRTLAFVEWWDEICINHSTALAKEAPEESGELLGWRWIYCALFDFSFDSHSEKQQLVKHCLHAIWFRPDLLLPIFDSRLIKIWALFATNVFKMCSKVK